MEGILNKVTAVLAREFPNESQEKLEELSTVLVGLILLDVYTQSITKNENEKENV